MIMIVVMIGSRWSFLWGSFFMVVRPIAARIERATWYWMKYLGVRKPMNR